MGAAQPLDALVAFLAARDDADPAVAPEMRSQVHRGAPGGGAVVLLHGMTASPPAWSAIAAELHARGRTVVVPRLPLHGHADRMTRALRDLDADALAGDVGAVVTATRALGERVTVAGHSLGATLALDAAVRLPAGVRAVAIAPFMGIASVPFELHPPFLRALSLFPGVFLWWHPLVRERLEPAHGYPRYPLGAIVAGLTIADRVRSPASRPAPGTEIDFVINAGEVSVNNRTALRLAREWRAAGVAVAIHRLRGLGWSHDIVEPARPPSRQALATLVDVIDRPHADGDREYVL